MTGNIRSAELVARWPNGRPFKHGAMNIIFYYPYSTRISAEAEIEQYMRDKLDYTRGVDYRIPAWNYPNNITRSSSVFVIGVTITFTSAETFVMTKLMWDNV
jgi:hypothetical protein